MELVFILKTGFFFSKKLEVLDNLELLENLEHLENKTK